MLPARLWRRLTLALLTLGGGVAPLEAQRDVAIRKVNVVDVEHGTILPRRTVIVHAGKITRIADGSNPGPRGAIVIDGNGEYLIPGLWDMHVHLLSRASESPGVPPDSAVVDALLGYMRALMIANGVTGVRDMGDDFATLKAWQTRAAARGEIVPRLLLTGEKLGVHPVLAGAPFPIRSPNDVRRSVQMLKAAGASHVKVQGLPEPLLREALAQCRELAMPCVGHVTRNLPLRELSLLGMRSAEHMFLLPEYTAAGFSTRISPTDDRPSASFFTRVMYKLGLEQRPPDPVDQALRTHDAAKAARLFRVIATKATWFTPTLTLSQMLYHLDPPDSIGRYDAYLLMERDSTFGKELRSPEWLERAQRLRAMEFRIIGELRDAGVPLLTGTDAPEYIVPGFAVHEEMALLVRAGLSPWQALRAATLEPARYMQATDSLGTVAPGRVADLLLVRGNPLHNIRATSAIDVVIARGRVIRRRGLDSLLALAKTERELMRMGQLAQPAGGTTAATSPRTGTRH